jgi:hypothetical protein
VINLSRLRSFADHVTVIIVTSLFLKLSEFIFVVEIYHAFLEFKRRELGVVDPRKFSSYREHLKDKKC